ncbi:DUF423 domain-containing protein [Thalassobacillus devorans]|uniref:DUF423 domain-containing protein n=1 Tax=Thalassobacillus devorans TaxID=279813 RepID=UPI000A1C986E|nr:DUF423 domain-containing protein [Thalassobacillus devorans]
MKLIFLLAVINGFLAVALGAFGAHGLEGKITEKALKTWEKAVTYQMFHTGALLAVGILMMKTQSGLLTGAGWLFFIGIVLFSGSLYVYAPTGIKALAMITPFGGLTFLVGWVLLGIAVTRML